MCRYENSPGREAEGTLRQDGGRAAAPPLGGGAAPDDEQGRTGTQSGDGDKGDQE